MEGGLPVHVSESGVKTVLEWADDANSMDSSIRNFRRIVGEVLKRKSAAEGNQESAAEA